MRRSAFTYVIARARGYRAGSAWVVTKTVSRRSWVLSATRATTLRKSPSRNRILN